MTAATLRPGTWRRLIERTICWTPNRNFGSSKQLVAKGLRGVSYPSIHSTRAFRCGRSLATLQSTHWDDAEASLSETDSTDSDVANRHGLDYDVDMEELLQLAKMRCTALSLKDMYKYAVDIGNMEQRILNAQFLHKELPLRIAQRAADMLTLPHGLAEVSHIRDIANFYLTYLHKFREMPKAPSTPTEEDAFTELLHLMLMDQRAIPVSVAKAVDEWLEENYGSNFPSDINLYREDSELREMEDALYRFFTARTGLRFLIEHHILSSPTRDNKALRKAQSMFTNKDNEPSGDYLGSIQTDCNPKLQVESVANDVKMLMMEHQGVCPEIVVVHATQGLQKSNFTYVPHHLQYMLRELLKNSCLAVIGNATNPSDPLPPVRVVIVHGDEDITIKVADRGGGIPRSQMVNVWRFIRPRKIDAEMGPGRFGLPMARIYARYFGGELTLKSMEGYGLDAYLHLPRLGDCCENLPLQVKYSPGELTSNPPRRSGH